MRIENSGPRITRTDYWRTPHAAGYCYVSTNAGAVRLLVPPVLLAEVRDALRTAVRASIDLAGVVAAGAQRLTLILEDDSPSPYVLDLDVRQADRLLPASEAGRWVQLIVYGPASADPEGVEHIASLPLLLRPAVAGGERDLSPVPPPPSNG